MKIYAVCSVAIAPLRADASDRAEIVSQLLFGDRVEVLEQSERWCRVLTKHDNYEAWMDPKQLLVVDEDSYTNENAFSTMSALNLANVLQDENHGYYYLSPGSTLPFYQDNFCQIADKRFKVLNKIWEPAKELNGQFIEQVAMFFLNTPYLWGGRSLFGIDCSGFSQIVYKLLGRALPRDASQQVAEGVVVDFLESATCGDLAFFDNEEGKITHVGIMLSNRAIIHAAGKVRIDRIDNQGIYNEDLQRYTHKLRIIKRLFV